MIRPATDADAPAVASLAVASGLFPEEEVAVVEALMADYAARERARGHACALDVDDGGEPVGVAYWQPALATDGAWYLTMIGVHERAQRQGRGAVLLRHVEDQLRSDGQRLLLVETSSSPDFAGARAFYAARGYDEEARVRDYYEPGDDMVLFRRALTA